MGPGARHEGGWLWTVSMTPLVTWAVYALMSVGVLLIVAGFISPSPTSMTAGKGPIEVKGVHRITRHPVVMGVGCSRNPGRLRVRPERVPLYLSNIGWMKTRYWNSS